MSMDNKRQFSTDQSLISRWNKSDPSLSKIIDIANYFNISLDELTGYKNTIDSSPPTKV